LRGDAQGLRVQPQLPAAWERLEAEREFRGARFHLSVRRTGVAQMRVTLDGQLLPDGLVRGIEAGRDYRLEVELP
jgi:cellobionic acid phosphorylase